MPAFLPQWCLPMQSQAIYIKTHFMYLPSFVISRQPELETSPASRCPVPAQSNYLVGWPGPARPLSWPNYVAGRPDIIFIVIKFCFNFLKIYFLIIVAQELDIALLSNYFDHS